VCRKNLSGGTDQIVDPILVANIVESADVRMAQGRNRVRLAVEPLLGLRVFRKMRGKDLDGNSAIKPCITGAIHFSHPASSQR
jgi:hypothetical protein